MGQIIYPQESFFKNAQKEVAAENYRIQEKEGQRIAEEEHQKEDKETFAKQRQDSLQTTTDRKEELQVLKENNKKQRD